MKKDHTNSLKNNEDTEQTRILYSLIEKRNIILEKMRKHSAAKEQEMQENSGKKHK